MRYGETYLASGTGFLVQTHTCVGLVTARHNLTGRDHETNDCLHTQGGVPDNIEVHHNGLVPSSNVLRSEPIIDGDGQALWIEHPHLGPHCDVVLLPLLNPGGVLLAPYTWQREYADTPIIGRFKRKTVRCYAKCRQTYVTHEEKETDVNIGVHLLADALRDRFDRALIISADTDLNSAVVLARLEAPGKRIDLVAPPQRMGRNSSALFEITKGRVRASLLPPQIVLPNGKCIIRPVEYDPPIVTHRQ